MIEVLDHALHHPFKTKSNFARENADLIAAAASEGFLTTRLGAGIFSRSWVLTPKGLSHLYVLQGRHHDHV